MHYCRWYWEGNCGGTEEVEELTAVPRGGLIESMPSAPLTAGYLEDELHEMMRQEGY